MGADQRLADFASIFNRRITERLLALQRVQELGRFVDALRDPVSGSWIDTSVRGGDMGPFIEIWRRQVDEVHRDAVAIGDRQLRTEVDTLVG